MQKEQPLDSQIRAFLPFKIPILSTASETTITEIQSTAQISKSTEQEIQTSQLQSQQVSASCNSKNFQDTQSLQFNTESKHDCSFKHSRESLMQPNIFQEDKHSVKWTESASNSNSFYQDEPDKTYISKYQQSRVQANHISKEKSKTDQSEFEEILSSFENVQSRSNNTPNENSVRAASTLPDFKEFVMKIYEIQMDYSKMNDLLDEIDHQISSSENKFKHNEMKSLIIKKYTLEKVMSQLYQKGYWTSEINKQSTEFQEPIQISIPLSHIHTRNCKCKKNSNIQILEHSGQIKESNLLSSVTEFQLSAQECNTESSLLQHKKLKEMELQVQQVQQQQSTQISTKRNLYTLNINKLTSRQLETVILNQEKQVDFYNLKYKINQVDQFFTSATTKMISLQEQEFIEDELQTLLKDRNLSGWQMLNIPCGNGRLNRLFSQFVSCIDCADPCIKACKNVALQKEYISNAKVGMISTKSIQKFVFEPKKKYHLIWCNYGYSFLNSNEASEFLVKARACLQPDGYLIIKDVVTDSKEILLNIEEQRVFRSLEQYTKELGAHFNISKYEFFYPMTNGGPSYRPEVMFQLQTFSRATAKLRKSSK